jgi:hypothetical protein
MLQKYPNTLSKWIRPCPDGVQDCFWAQGSYLVQCNYLHFLVQGILHSGEIKGPILRLLNIQLQRRRFKSVFSKQRKNIYFHNALGYAWNSNSWSKDLIQATISMDLWFKLSSQSQNSIEMKGLTFVSTYIWIRNRLTRLVCEKMVPKAAFCPN